MQADQQIWRSWANLLQRWGMEQWVASFLEAAGPLTIFGAQLVYLGQPFVKAFWPDERMGELAHMLEEPALSSAFARFLREENIR